MLRGEILNRIAKVIDAKDYLEIGVQLGWTFSVIEVENMVGVDPSEASAATVHMTSDAYFADLPDDVLFDLIFVDGLHRAPQVIKDVHNAMRHLKPGGVIVCHDCNPPTEESASIVSKGTTWCGDVWEGWLELRRQLDAEMYVVDTDLGCGVIRPDRKGNKLNRPLPKGWNDFAKNRSTLLNLITVEQFVERWSL